MCCDKHCLILISDVLYDYSIKLLKSLKLKALKYELNLAVLVHFKLLFSNPVCATEPSVGSKSGNGPLHTGRHISSTVCLHNLCSDSQGNYFLPLWHHFIGYFHVQHFVLEGIDVNLPFSADI